MNTFLFTLLCIVVAWIVFDAVYSRIVCRYYHTKIKYQLFALRDRLRTIHIENPSFDDRVLRMLELQINGCIGLVRRVSFHRLIVATFSESFINEEDRKSALEMGEITRWIIDNKETEVGKQLFDISRQSISAFQDSLTCNSPLVTMLFRYVIRPIVLFQPHVAEKFKKVKDNFMKEIAPAMMVHAAR